MAQHLLTLIFVYITVKPAYLQFSLKKKKIPNSALNKNIEYNLVTLLLLVLPTSVISILRCLSKELGTTRKLQIEFLLS